MTVTVTPPASSATRTRSPSPTDLGGGRQPALIVGVNVGARTITIDAVQWFEGEAAVIASVEDGGESPPPNDYWIRNESPRLRTLKVPPGTKITTNVLTGMETGDVSQDVVVSLRKLSSLDGLEGALFWVYLDHGKAIQISEQYLP